MARRIAQRPAADGANVLLELADRAAVDRPVTRIVDARRDLVDQQSPVARLEHLDRHDAHIVERFQQPRGDLSQPQPSAVAARAPAPASCAGCGSRAGFRPGRNRQRARPFPRAATTDNSRVKSTKPSRMHGTRLKFVPSERQLLGRAHHALPLAVIAEPRRLQHRRHADLRKRRAQTLIARSRPQTAPLRSRDRAGTLSRRAGLG